MTRISPWVFRAIAGFFLVAGFLFSGCLSGSGREVSPALILSPSSALQGDVLSVTLTVPGIDFNNCSNSPQSLVFTDPNGGRPIDVHRIDKLLLDSSSVRAYISIGADAAVSEYTASLQCSADTGFSGNFRVDSVPSQVTLSVDPVSLAAGTFGQIVTLSTDGPFFTDDTEFFFEQKDFIVITEKRRLDDFSLGKEMELVLDIDPLIPLGDMPITAVANSRVAEGIITITDRVKSTVFVTPDQIQRQAANQDTPPVYDISILGESIDFIEADKDAGDDDPNATVIDFPENPGITVLDDISVQEFSDGTGVKKQLKAQIRVDSLATLGGTPLHVSTGSQEAWTNFTVLLPKDTPLLQITSPKSVPRNGTATAVFAEAVNFTFEGWHEVRCRETGCKVQNIFVDPNTYKSMTMEVIVDADMLEPYIAVEVEMPDFTAREYIAVKDAEAAVLIPDPNTVEQGAKAESTVVSLTLSDMSTFSADASVQVLARSGLRIDQTKFVSGLNEILVWFDVADDAPVGPAYIAVNANGSTLEAPLNIKPMEGYVPQMSLSPGATLRKRDIVLVRVRGSGFDLPIDASGFAFDDPGLQIAGMYPDSDGSVVLSVDVSPRAREDMAVLYAKGANGQAAATFRTLEFQKTEILNADPFTVSRTTGGTNPPTITVQGEGIVFNMPVVDISDDIGVEVMQVTGGQYLVFDLGVDETGFGGWTGLVVKDDTRNYLVPMFIDAGGDLTLTTFMNPEIVSPGAEQVVVTATLPSAMTVDASVLEVQTGHPGAYVAEPKLISEHMASFFLDVSHDAVEVGGNQIPIFIVTPDGAGLGYISISEVTVNSLLEGETWDGAFEAGETTRFLVDDPGPFPSFFQAEFEKSRIGDPMVSLVANNGLDTADKSDSGMIWMMNKDVHRFSVSAEQDGDAAIVKVRSRGRNSVEENVTVTGSEWILDEDPCDVPFLGRGAIQGALDVDTIFMKHPGCDLTVFTAARSMADRPWETPELDLKYTDIIAGTDAADTDTGGTLIGENAGSLHDDPVLSINPDLVADNMDIAVSISAELGSAGAYLVQIRRPYAIRELSISENAPFIEIELPVNAELDLNLCELVLYDTEEDVQLGDLVLGSDTGDTDDTDIADITNDGIVVIAGMPMDEADAVHDVVAMLSSAGSFAVLLLYDGVVVDAVQFGEGTVSLGEGQPYIIASDNRPTFVRVADIDTNDNASDFAATYIATPGS